MSQGGRKDRRRDLLAKLKALHVGPNDVVYVEVPQSYFDDETAAEQLRVFLGEVSKATGRAAFATTEGQERIEVGPLSETAKALLVGEVMAEVRRQQAATPAQAPSAIVTPKLIVPGRRS